MAFEAGLIRYINLMVDLHVAVALKGASQGSDAIRQQMDEPWAVMSEYEKAIALLVECGLNELNKAKVKAFIEKTVKDISRDNGGSTTGRIMLILNDNYDLRVYCEHKAPEEKKGVHEDKQV